jgi:hypothetical protein
MRSCRKRIGIALASALLLLLLLATSAPALAQDYSFTVDETVVDVWINPDGSVSLEYWLTFTCDEYGHPIDVVDLGLPTDEYSLTAISASSKGRQIAYVEESEWVYYGVAIWLGDGTIFPGESGTVHVTVDRVGGMIYEDSDDPGYASTEFIPNYFEGGFVQGTTDMTVRMHLPAGVQPDEPRYHRSPSGWPQTEPGSYHDADGLIVYEWYHPTADPGREYTFGASYPRTYVDEDVIQEPPSVWELLATTIEDGFSCLAGSCPLVCVGGVFAGIVGLSIYGQSRRKMKYLPPSMKVEGVGIKRGLTAVEAAILLETPLDKVLTMTLFGLLKKGAVTVLDDDPLRVKANTPVPKGLRLYEESFLEAIKKSNTLSEPRLRTMMVELVKSVNTKMKGFSRKETSAYYNDIVRRAWAQVEGAETPELRSKYIDEGLEWTMLDEDFGGRVDRTFGTGPVFVPPWYIYYRPWVPATTGRTAGAATSRAPSPSRPSTGRVQLPSLPGSAFAANIVRGVQSTASNIVRSVTGFTGGVTNVTNPPPKVSSSSRGLSGGGGSGCACACACACAGCACACAGGGR